MSKVKLSPADAEDVGKTRPDVFGYHDYRSFLKDWFAYLKGVDRDFSLRSLATEAQISPGYLPLVVSGQRNLSEKICQRLIPLLKLAPHEQTYLENLVRLGSKDTVEGQIKALARMKRSRTYKARNPNEVEFFEYMSRWYHIVIREMATLEGFKSDPVWIRDKLKVKLPLGTIKTALEFLVENGYLLADESGRICASKELLKCVDEVYSKTLRFYHKQMLSLAGESMSNTPNDERYLFGYTFSLGSENFVAAKAILQKAVRELEELQEKQAQARDSVYHLELALFPVVKKGEP